MWDIAKIEININTKLYKDFLVWLWVLSIYISKTPQDRFINFKIK